MKKLVILLTLTFTFVACNTGSKYSKELEIKIDKQNNLENSVMNVLNKDGSFKKVKSNSVAPTNGNGNYMVVQDLSTGEFLALNIAKFDSATMTSFDDFKLALFDGDLVGDLNKVQKREWKEDGEWKTTTAKETIWTKDINGVLQSSEVEREVKQWVDTSRWVTKTTYEKGNYVFEKNASNSKDLELLGSLDQKFLMENFAENLSEQYGLSLNRSNEIARLMVSYKKLEKEGSLTTADTKAFGEEVLGVELATFTDAYMKAQNGENDELEAILEKTSVINDISIEHAQEIVETLLK